MGCGGDGVSDAGGALRCDVRGVGQGAVHGSAPSYATDGHYGHTHTHTRRSTTLHSPRLLRAHTRQPTPPPSRSGGEGGCQHHGSGGDGRREWRRWEEEGGEAGMLKGEAEGGRQLGDFSEDGTSHFAPSLTLLPPASPPHPAAQADGVVRERDITWRRGGGGRLNGGEPQRQQEGGSTGGITWGGVSARVL